jgi:predicted Zn-dependent protease
MRVPRRCLSLLATVLLAGCGQEPAPEETPRITAADRARGAEQHPLLLAEFGGAYQAEEARYVAAVGERVAVAAGLGGQCKFTLVNSDVVNAFAVPGCYIYMTRGLLATVTSEAELASVLGHELGHIVAAHAQRQERRSLWRTLGVIAVGLTGSEGLTRLAGKAAEFFTLRYSRKQEYEADDLGLRFLEDAGYDPYASAEMLDALGRQQAFMVATSGRDEARSIPEWTLSHPLTENRVQRARAAASATGLANDELPEEAEPYLREVDGLLYGDDPAQGFVSGQRFAHPVMRIAFVAPPGFALTNSPRAIRLSGPNGIRGEFGGGPMADADIAGHAVAIARKIAGDTPVEIARPQRRSVNGIDAAVIEIGIATQQGTVPVAIAAYDGGGGQAYHFIIVSPPADASARAIAALFGSFRRLSAEEAAQLRPRVIRTITAAPGDTLDRVVGRMADPNPGALFAMLNGRPAGRPLRPGEHLKIVVFDPPQAAAISPRLSTARTPEGSRQP